MKTMSHGATPAPRAISWALVLAMVLVQMVVLPRTATAADTGATTETAVKVNEVLFDPAPIDPSGVVHLGGSELLVTDSEINEVLPSANNVWHMSTAGVISSSGRFSTTPIEPTGLGYNAANKHLYISNDAGRWIEDRTAGADGKFGTGDDSSTFMSTSAFGVNDPEDVTWDPKSGRIFIAGGTARNITPVSPGPNGRFDGIDDVVGKKIDVSKWVLDLEGIGYRAKSDTLLLVDPTGGVGANGLERIYEVTKTGRLVRVINMGFTELPSDVDIAPATVGGGSNLYVVDRGDDSNTNNAAKDGRLFELSVPFANLAPFVNAGPNKSTPINRVLTLTGDSYDDGQPTTKAPTLAWSKVTGPGSVSFTAPAKATTNVTFSKLGTYVLKLNSSDGSLQNSDTVQVTVTAKDSFIDDDGHTFEADIEWMAGEGITRGCNPPKNDRFCPNDFVTRGQMAAFLVRALDYTDNGGGDLFIDDDGSTFENDIDKLGTAGVTRGCNPPKNDRFCPNDFVTRGQMAAFLVRAMGYTDNGGGDLFIDDDGSTFENDIDRLGTAGVTRGCNPPTNDRYCPGDFVTRGQMAAFLHRALG